MGHVVNLRTARKQIARDRKAARAAENRALHGQSKAQRNLIEARADKARHELDLHRMEDGEES